MLHVLALALLPCQGMEANSLSPQLLSMLSVPATTMPDQRAQANCGAHPTTSLGQGIKPSVQSNHSQNHTIPPTLAQGLGS